METPHPTNDPGAGGRQAAPRRSDQSPYPQPGEPWQVRLTDTNAYGLTVSNVVHETRPHGHPTLEDAMAEPDPTPNEAFLMRYAAAFDDAKKIVLEREQQSGRNAVFTIPQMFARGLTDLMGILYMKVARGVGASSAGNTRALREELVDILNYAAFGIAMIDGAPSEGGTENHEVQQVRSSSA